jgi:hypothetical protein
MGNSNSSANTRPSGVPNRRVVDDAQYRNTLQSPSTTTTTAAAATSSSTSHATHPSLRTKKKSLELPDLASLAFSNSQHSPYSASNKYQHQITSSSPIPIPISPHVNASSRTRNQNNFQSTDAFLTEPSTHIPIPTNSRSRQNPHIRGAPMPYNSTHSFISKPAQNNQPRMNDSPKHPPPFIPETVHSTIPIALTKAKQELVREAGEENATVQQHLLAKQNSSGDDPKEPIPVKITWHGGGKSVILARAGHDNWKGRQPMERECAHHPLSLF